MVNKLALFQLTWIFLLFAGWFVPVLTVFDNSPFIGIWFLLYPVLLVIFQPLLEKSINFSIFYVFRFTKEEWDAIP